jgi:hypothetical protein
VFFSVGAHIYNKLLEFLKGEYWKRGFQAGSLHHNVFFHWNVDLAGS